MPPFIPTPERPCFQTRTEAATDGHPEHAAWAARRDAANAARHGPPTPAEAHNRAQLAVLERFLLGRVRTRELR
ncbi:hypothetical protein HZF05_08440 [Sphingomonas sp. CGMCC 1.13654]|uniref:Uncharacterized protein n=1 Tax=Sphingomonas chungangi TaxID=2683589 RepID=A0A838L9D6_9SPHN|nr:hypothetical protein [Sphingomonas chungangi]MBA2934128.1 hypothetical protein [Sphingomonas chungangi]MVW57169.1 hypothetical protein [Sphingomonas chungangi]